jgi:hypothetical protein
MSTPSPATRAAIVAAGALLLLAALFAVRVGLADLDHFRAKKLASGWNAGEAPPSPDDVLRAEAAIQASLRHWRADPDALTLAAQIRGWKGYALAGNDPDALNGHYREALAMLREALRLRPAHASTWALVAEYKTLVGERDDEWHLARERALELGGADIRLVLRMTRLDADAP